MASNAYDTLTHYRRQLNASMEACASVRRMALALEALEDRNDVIETETIGMWHLHEEFVVEIDRTHERAEADGYDLRDV